MIMGRKIFVSYKYMDSNVEELDEAVSPTWPSDYVSYIQKHIITDKSDNIYKGEKNDEDLSDKSDDYIWEHLKDKLYDSTVTIVLISPNMKEPNKWERNQWIPWEISYSLRKTTRGGRTSQRNALLAVILPNKNGNYDYYENLTLFRILQKNIDNGLAKVVRWSYFKSYPNTSINSAVENLGNIIDDDIVKSV